MSKLKEYDYFSGGLPAGIIFFMSTEELRNLVTNYKKEKGRPNNVAEVSFIALIAYFESFCKNHFASILNICPELIDCLKKTGQDIKVDSTAVINLGKHIHRKLGFIIAEQYDFGTPQKINSLYQAILKMTPFSKDDRKKYERILNDRNLLVHHGGIYTMRYSEQRFAKKVIGDYVYWHSLSVDNKMFFDTVDFLEKLVDKIAKTTVDKLFSFVQSENIVLTKTQKDALGFSGVTHP